MSQLQALELALDALSNCPVEWMASNFAERDEAKKVLTEMIIQLKQQTG